MCLRLRHFREAAIRWFRIWLICLVQVWLALPVEALQAGYVGRMGPASGSGRAVTMQFAGADSLPSYITFTRASARTCWNSSGVMVALGNDVPCLDHNPVTLAPRGLLIEGQRTNLLLNSASLATQSVTVSAVAYTLSFYGTGSVTLSGVSSGTLNGAGAFPSRATLTFTPSAGTLTLTVTGSVQFANLEAGSFASSYIPTTGTSATRAADSALITSLSTIGFNATEGVVLTEYEYMAAGATQVVWRLYSDASNFMGLRRGTGSPGNLITEVFSGGASQFAEVSPMISANTVYKSAFGYAFNNAASVTNGTVSGNDTSITIPTVSTLGLGRDNTANQMFGWLQRFTYYPSRLPNETLQQLTQ